MPKISASSRSKLKEYVTLFGSEIFSTDGKVLLCKICEREVKADKKFLVVQHVKGAKHTALVEKKAQVASSSVSQLKPFLEAAGKQSQFTLDLCDAFVSADIPLYKLDNPKLRSFFEKYKHPIPCSATVRLNYLKIAYESRLDYIRNYVGDKQIWVSSDETTDATGRFVAHIIVGTLESVESKSFLLHAECLEKTNSATISQCFMTALTVLWPSGVKHDRVLLFVTDGANYMKAAGKALKVLFPRMLHVTCVAHGLHRVTEKIRALFSNVDELISNGKKVFLKAAARKAIFRELAPGIPLPPQPVISRWGTWLKAAAYYAEHLDTFSSVVRSLDKKEAESIKKVQRILELESLRGNLAFIDAHFRRIPQVIEQLEERNASLIESTDRFEELLTELKNTPGPNGVKVRKKCDYVLSHNPDYHQIKTIREILRGASPTARVGDLQPSEVSSFKFAPIVSADAERSFSILKQTLSDRRHRFTFDNLKMVVVVHCNQVS